MVEALLTVGGLGTFVKVLIDLLKKFHVLTTEGAGTVGVALSFSLLAAYAAGWATLGITPLHAVEYFVVGVLGAATAVGMNVMGDSILAPEKLK